MFTSKLRYFALLAALAFVGVLLSGGVAFAAKQTVTVTCGPLTTPGFINLNDLDSLYVKNGCGSPLDSIKFNNGTAVLNLVAGDSTKFTCTNSDCDIYRVWEGAEIKIGREATCSTNIPTLSEWALIIFSVVLLGLLTYYIVRRRRTAPVAV